MARGLASTWSLGWILAVAPARAAAAGAIDEVAHEIDVDLHTDHATLVVRRTFATNHVDGVEAHFSIGVGAPLVATGLSTRADDGRWHRANLMDVRDAVETYWMLTGSRKVVPERELPRVPGEGWKDPALMMWSPMGLDVYAFPVTDVTPRSVEYTLQVAYAYEDGSEVLRIPVGGEHELPPRVRFGRVPAGVVATVEGTRVIRGAEIDTSYPDVLEVKLRRDRPPLSITLASIPAGARHMYRISVEVAKALGPDPARTHAVIVLDRSRSMGPDSMAAARTALLAYLDRLAEFPGTRVEVIGFDRRVVAEHGRFVAPKEARDALASATLSQANGSDLPAALAEAAARLETAPRDAPRRVIIVSDAALAPDHEAKIEAALEAVHAVVHLVDVTGADVSGLEVAFDHRLFDAVAKTGGNAWVGSVDPAEEDVGELFDALVRPTRIERVKLRVDGVEIDPFASGDLLIDGGEGGVAVRLSDTAPRRVAAEGWLWGRPIRVGARRSAATDRDWSRVAAAYLSSEMSDDEIVDVARRGGAVSPKTALLALEPGVRPSEAPASVEAPEVWGRTTDCSLGGGHSGGFGRYALQFDEAAFVRDAIAAAISTCGGTSLVEVAMTTSYAEVLAIDRVEASGDDALEACVREELWALELPPGRSAIVHHTVTSKGVQS